MNDVEGLVWLVVAGAESSPCLHGFHRLCHLASRIGENFSVWALIVAVVVVDSWRQRPRQLQPLLRLLDDYYDNTNACCGPWRSVASCDALLNVYSETRP